MSGDQASSPASTRKREATCNAILDATSQLIAEKGVAGFTMSEVAARGKVNRALIYHYYHDRDNLIFETIRHIVNRYDEIRSARGEDSIEQDIRMHIEHPEIARFFFHLMLTGKPLPKLSRRIASAIGELEHLKAAGSPGSTFDPTFAIITAWLIQLAWSCSREEIARLLGLPVEETDRRFIGGVRRSSQLIRGQVARGGAQATDQP
jgi:AcrR family transcriptional regulator